MNSIILVAVSFAFGVCAGQNITNFLYPGLAKVPPNLCNTTEGNPGFCIDIYQCNHLAAMLVQPVSQKDRVTVKKLRCKGSTISSVCCEQRLTKLATYTPDTRRVPHRCERIMAKGPPNPSTGCCGVDSRIVKRITGGSAPAVDEYPWMALLEYNDREQIKLLCGGGLITASYVLTAAHCIITKYGKPINVRLGEYDSINEGPDCLNDGMTCTEGMIRIPIKRGIPYPQYNRVLSRKYDIGLIQLKTSAPYTDFIRPICLPSADLILSPPLNFTMHVAGWGQNRRREFNRIKQHIELPYVAGKECQLSNHQFCAGGENGKDTCPGDSGGPLVYQINNSFKAIGLVSFGPNPCGQRGLPGVYTHVFPFLNWIMKNIVH